MQVTGKVVVVTGGGNGIGKAMCEAFHRAGAAKVVVADIDPDGARAVATPIGGAAFKCDVGKEKDILHVIDETEHQFGPIALFCSNAGIGGGFDPLSVECRRQLRRAVAAQLGGACHGACLCGAAPDPAHEGARRRLFPQHDFGGRFAVAGRQPGLFDHQACRGRLCRKSRDLAQGRQHQGVDPVPAGRRHQHAALDPEGPAIRRRRPVAGAGGAGRAEGTGSRKPS